MLLVFSLMYQLTKPYKSSEISPIAMTLWWDGPSCSWIHQRTAVHLFENHIRWTISSSNRKMAELWEALFLIISNICMEHFVKLALDSAQHKPLLCLLYVDAIIVVWTHGPEWLHNSLSHFNILRPSIQFTMKQSHTVWSLLWCSDPQERDDNGHQSLQKNHPQGPIPHIQI
jgi:hypothetical protein